MASFVILAFLDVAHSLKRTWFERNKGLSMLITFSAYVFILLVCVCRLYLGRHSIDQILLGCFFGFGMAHFCKHCFRPYMYDPVFCPKPEEDPKMIAARSRTAAIRAWLVYFLICIKVVLLYEYVERNHMIP